MKTTKKYRINIETANIESFTFICKHPENTNYIIILDEHKEPVRMLKKDWNEMKITDYEKAKIELIKHLQFLIRFYQGEDLL